MSNVKGQRLFIILFLGLLLFPQVSWAGEYTGYYDQNDNGKQDEGEPTDTVYYDGLVPCGKKACKGYSESTCGTEDKCVRNGKNCKNKCGVKLIECCLSHGFPLKDACAVAGGNMFPNSDLEKFLPCQFCHLFIMLDGILDFVIEMAFIVAVLMLVFAGLILIVGRILPEGISPGTIQRAWSIMGSVATGLIIIFASWVIVNTIFIYVLRVEEENVGFTGPSKWSQIICPIELPE